MKMKINAIEIKNFKSIAHIRLDNLTPFSVFVGANGSGKSNLFDALAFVSSVIELGANKAIRQLGGFDQIHCYKLNDKAARTFEFKIEGEFENDKFSYELKINEMDSDPIINDELIIDNRYFKREDIYSNGLSDFIKDKSLLNSLALI